MGSGCGSVGRAVASDTRDPWFVSRHQQNFTYQLYNRKDKNTEKEAGNGPSFKKGRWASVIPIINSMSQVNSKQKILVPS